MKKKFLSLFLVFILLCSLHVPVQAAQLKGQLGFFTTGTELTPGDMRAVCGLTTIPDDEVLFIAAYYLADGTLASFVSDTVTDRKNHYITLTIPDTVSFGDYAKVIAFNKRTLEPVKPTTIISTKLFCSKALVTDVETAYQGINERYYTLESPLGSLTASGTSLSLSNSPTPFRLKDMTEGEYAFEDYTTPRLRITYSAENGFSLTNYIAGDSSQRFVLEKYNDGYCLALPSGGYIAAKGGKLAISNSKYEWSLNLKGESPFTIATGLDGFKDMTEAEKARFTQICTSIGADALPSADNSGASFLDNIEATFISVYIDRDKLTAEEEKAKLLAAVSAPVMGELVGYHTVPTFPGGDAVITQSAPSKTTHVMWDLVEENSVIYSASDAHPYTGEPINCYRIDVTYKTATTTQTVAVYCVDPSFANVQTAITALGKFPYAYRRYIKNMYVYLSTTTSSFNCGGEELFVRLGFVADENTLITGFAHELGHSVDMMANGNVNNTSTHWCQGATWQKCVADDIATVSTYGNSNYYEGIAEFARLYWLSFGNRDLQIGIKQLYPNQFASFQRLLTKVGCSSNVIY